MGTITISVDAGAAGATSMTKTYTNANLGRLATWMKETVGSGSDGTPLTNEQAFQRWMQWTLDMSKAHMIEHERRKQAVPDFEPT